jgi:1,4-alpha-glucan branching enzyme
VLNTDSETYGGSNVGNSGGVFAEFEPMHGQKYSVLLNLPPLGAVFFKGKV